MLQADGLRPPGAAAGARPRRATSAAVFGHPGGGPLERRPFQVGRRGHAPRAPDIYDPATDVPPGPVPGRRARSRATRAARSSTRPARSVGVAFAIAPDEPDVAYALTVAEVEAVLAGDLEPANRTPVAASV